MDYLLHVLVMVALFVILATSFNLLIGFAGLFALSHAAFFGVGAYVSAILATQFGVAFPLTLLASIAFTALIGMLVALPALRIGGDYLVIVTLALQVIVITVILNWNSVTGGTDGIRGIAHIELFGAPLDSAAKMLPLAALIAAISAWIAWRLAHSPFGRSLRAMRENEAATQAIGKNVVAMKVQVFAFSAGLAAVAGSLFAHYISFVSAESFPFELTIYMLAMVILGGTGNLAGSVVGAVLLVLLPELLKFIALPPDVADKLRNVLYGLTLILILRARPQGLLPERGSTNANVADAAPRSAPAIAATHEAMGQTALAGRALAKSFGGIAAVRNFDIELRHGEITGLIGPNGAGKTTAFNLLTGFLQPDSGSVQFAHRTLSRLRPHQIVHAGVARSFQDLKLFRNMSALENVLAALPRQSGENLFYVYFTPWKVAREEQQNIGRALAILAFVKLESKAIARAGNLAYAEQKLLVIARLLATGAQVLLFDEPLSGLDPNTLEQIFPVIRTLARQGMAICIIEHNLDVIRGLCDRVVFLDEGTQIAEGSPQALIEDPVLAARYFK
jgi:branched-chain amino acid transport system permease protein